MANTKATAVVSGGILNLKKKLSLNLHGLTCNGYFVNYLANL
jgi:hypothetical protein